MTITAILQQKQSPIIRKCLPWVVCLVAGLLFFYEFIQMNMFNSLSQSLITSFHLSLFMVGLLSAIYFYTNGGLIFVAGNLLDHFSTRFLILLALMLCTLGTFIFAFSPNFALLVLARFIVGIGGAFCFLSVVKLSSSWLPSDQQGTIIGLVVMMAMIGGMVAQTPLTLLIHRLGWREALIADGLLGVLFTIIVYFIVEDYPKENNSIPVHKQPTSIKALVKNIKFVLTNRQNWLGASYTCLMNLSMVLLGAFFGIIYLHQIDHLSAVDAATVSSMIFGGTIVGSPLSGWISDRIKNRRLPMLAGSLLALLAVLPIIYVHTLSYMSLFILFFLLGLLTSTQVIGYPVVEEHNPIQLTATAVSIISMLTVLGGGISIPLVAWVLNHYGISSTVGGISQFTPLAYQHAMLILPICFIIAFIVALLIKETHCKRDEMIAKDAQLEL